MNERVKKYGMPALTGFISAAASAGVCMTVGDWVQKLFPYQKSAWHAPVWEYIDKYSLQKPIMLISTTYLIFALMLLCEKWYERLLPSEARGEHGSVLFRTLFLLGGAVTSAAALVLSTALNGAAALDSYVDFMMIVISLGVIVIYQAMVWILTHLIRIFLKKGDFSLSKSLELLLSLVFFFVFFLIGNMF